jgi:hypothetical protein
LSLLSLGCRGFPQQQANKQPNSAASKEAADFRSKQASKQPNSAASKQARSRIPQQARKQARSRILQQASKQAAEFRSKQASKQAAESGNGRARGGFGRRGSRWGKHRAGGKKELVITYYGRGRR